MNFEWDEEKNLQNIAKHGVDFANVKELFSVPHKILVDDRRDYGEQRLIAVGYVGGRPVIVVFTKRFEVIYRIISARVMNSKERARFWMTTNFEN